MDEGAKQRLVGAAVLVALAVIFLPMLFEKRSGQTGSDLSVAVPATPAVDTSLPDEAEAAIALPPPENFGWDDPEPSLPGTVPVPDSAQAALTPAAPPVRVIDPAPGIATSSPPPRVAPTAPATSVAPGAGKKTVPAGLEAWVVQVASVRSADSARKLRDDLRRGGFAAFIEEAVVNGATTYRVRVGPEVEKSDAQVSAQQLSALGHKVLVQAYR